MTLPGVVLGRRLGPFPGRLDPDLIRRYAAATNDPSPGTHAGTSVPAVALVTQIWDAQQAAFAELVPDQVVGSMTGGVHGEHDVVLHRPVVPGERLQTWAEGHGSRRAGRHVLVTLRYSTFDDHDTLVAEQRWTTVLLNAAGEAAGEDLPDHAFPQHAREAPAGDYVVNVDGDLPRRYAEVSGDWSGHHFNVQDARRSGFDRPFLHGLCTMALCAQGIVALVAGGEPERIRRIAVRFASPVFVGENVEMSLYEAGTRTYAFEADSAGAAVVRNGLAEIRP